MASKSLGAKIETLLFSKAEAVSVARLSEILDRPKKEVEEGLAALTKNLEGRGIVLMRNGDEVMLGTSPESSALIEKMLKEELDRDIGRAGVETLSIVLYMAPVSRADIDYIRGVSSTFILRHLLVRGLVERTGNPNDRRSFLYRPTFDLLRHLGVKQVSELPEYDSVREEIAARAVARKASEEQIKAEE